MMSGGHRKGPHRPALERHEPTDPSPNALRSCRLTLWVARVHEMQCGAVRQGDVTPHSNLAVGHSGPMPKEIVLRLTRQLEPTADGDATL